MGRFLAVVVAGLLSPVMARAESVPLAPGADLFGVALNLLLVIGLILLIAWLFRRYQGTNGAAVGAIRVVAALPMGTRERVVLLDVGGEQVLVGVSAGRMQRLHVLQEPIDAGAAAPASGSFAHRLREAVRSGRE